MLAAAREFGPASAAIAGAMAVRTIAQALSLWLIARALGPAGYGAITAVVSIAGAFGYMLAFGAPLSMINTVARKERALPDAWRDTLSAAIASIPLLLLSYAAFARFVLPAPVPWLVAGCFAVAEIAVLPLCQACVYAALAAERRGDAARLTLLPAVVRLLFAAALWPIVLWLDPARSLPVWASMYLLSALLALALSLRFVRSMTMGDSHRPRAGLAPTIREGLPFALSSLLQKISADADKALIASMVSLAATGTYGLAYRMIEMAQMPLHALAMATTTHFARHRQQGHRAAARELLHILPLPLLYALISVPMLLVLARLVPWVFGPGFASAAGHIVHLAFLPLLMAPRIQAQAALNAAGMQARVAGSHFAGASLGITINLCLLPRWGIGAAITAAYCVEGLLLLLQAFILYRACMIPHSSEPQMPIPR
jgi:O-antigen/teichoic acid export membrane protein